MGGMWTSRRLTCGTYGVRMMSPEKWLNPGGQKPYKYEWINVLG